MKNLKCLNLNRLSLKANNLPCVLYALQNGINSEKRMCPLGD